MSQHRQRPSTAWDVIDDDFDADDVLADPVLLRCDECNGTGLSIEGWNCEGCDGEGDFAP